MIHFAFNADGYVFDSLSKEDIESAGESNRNVVIIFSPMVMVKPSFLELSALYGAATSD